MRISGLSYYKTVDAAWETFWQYVSASIGLTMTSVAAFRSLFISHRVSHRQQETSDLEFLWLLYNKAKKALRRTLSIQSWRAKAWNSRDNDARESSDAYRGIDLVKIERGTITGLRTFIRQCHRTPATPSQIMYSQTGIEIDDYRETWTSPDKVAIRKSAGNHRHDKISSPDVSGRHEKILASKESRSHDKILAHKESRKHDKILDSQESRKHDKVLDKQEACEHDKLIATTSRDKNDTILARPEKARSAPVYHGSRSVNATGDSEFDGSRSWFRGSAGGRMVPKTRAGMMAKMKCGGFVFSAGFKAERYKEEV